MYTLAKFCFSPKNCWFLCIYGNEITIQYSLHIYGYRYLHMYGALNYGRGLNLLGAERTTCQHIYTRVPLPCTFDWNFGLEMEGGDVLMPV